MITPADSAPVAPEQMPATSFSIVAPSSDSSVGPSKIAGGTRDDLSGTVAGSITAAMSRQNTHKADTYSQGSQIGTPVEMPAETSTGSDGGAYYDPPRDY